MQNSIIFILFLFLITSCQNQITGSVSDNDSQESYSENEYSRDGGKVQAKVINNIRYEAQYRPVDEIIAMESKNKKLTEEEYNNRKKELDGMQYYLIRIRADKTDQDVLTYNMTDQNEYFARDNYYAFDFKHDIQLLDSDTLMCGLYHYINTHGLSPHVEMLMAFKENQSKQDRTLVIFDQVFKSGIIKFRFPADLFENEEPIIASKS